MGTSGNVLERLPAREGRTSTIFNNPKNLASSSQELGPDITGNTMVPESEMIREPQKSSIPAPRFQRGGGILNYTGGTYSHNGMIEYARFPISELHLGKFPDSVGISKAVKSTSRLKYVQNQQILISQCTGSKMVPDSKVNRPTCDIAIDCGAIRCP